MPRNKRKPRLTSAIFLRADPRTIDRIDAARGTESASTFIRQAIEVALLKAERAAMTAAAESRALAAQASAPDRADLELRPVPEPSRETP